MSVIVTFACGHKTATHAGGAPPCCEIDGERRVTSVKAPNPTFRGVATGPYAEFVQLPAKPVSLTEKVSE